MNRIRIQVDGYTIEAAEGQSLLQAALDAGIYIPHLCHHPDLKPQGGCKLCTVEIEGRPGCLQSCETAVEAGMVVRTKTEQVKKLRMVALELMLASHPKDCTSCDKYLNCELQALMQYMGVAHSRLREIEKENTRLSPSDRLIRKEMYRCIQCGRCVRACQELRGVGVLVVNRQGGESYIGTLGDRPLEETDCRFCGACVEVCPTGAIQDVRGVFSKDSPRNMALVPCKDQCPAHTEIPTYLRLTEQGRYGDAVSVLREKLTFPHALGLVCTHLCETGCKRTHVNGAVSIRDMKRFAVENDTVQPWKAKLQMSAPNGMRVAVVGAGPAGMTGAYLLARKGYAVTVFERQKLPGGMLSYGIPKYRLPQDIVDTEIAILKEAGIEIRTGASVDSVHGLKEEGFDAILVAVGSHKGKRPPQYQKAWENAYDAVDFCRMANEGTLPELGSRVMVYGGGNVAFDCARSAKKLGIPEVRVVCLEARENMLADREEIESALEERVEILNSMTVTGISEQGDAVKALNLAEVIRFRFGEKGLELELEAGSETALETDTLVFATGQQPELNDDFGLPLVKGSHIQTDEKLQTGIEGVFAAGDAVYGTKSVVEAIASGRNAAASIDRYLGGDGSIDEQLFQREPSNPNIGVIEGFAAMERTERLHQHCEAQREGQRCLQCDLRLDIRRVKYWVDAHYKTVREVTE